MIGEKLDFFMKLTGTRNTTLGKALSFDASYISRIRSGERGVPKNHPFLQPAAEFFARRVREPYQKAAVAQVIPGLLVWPEDTEEAAARIAAWLSDDEDASFAAARIREAEREKGQQALREDGASLIGNEGRRRGVETFLSSLLARGGQHTLLLYSDEDMDWLTADKAFAARWAELLAALLKSGSRIRIIHNVRRGIGEMLLAIRHWMPLYMTGAIEPYYCPKVRDNISCRTLFLAKGEMALIADSVGGAVEGMPCFLIRDPASVKALAREYEDRLALSSPLFRVFKPVQREQLGVVSERLLGQKRERVLSAMGEEGGVLPQPLQGLLQAAQAAPATCGAIPSKVCVIAREDVDALVLHLGEPFAAFYVSEQQLSSALYSYLERIREG